MNLFGAVWLPLLVAYAATLWWVQEMWYFREAYYGHGPLVVAGLAWLLWARRGDWRASPARVDARGWLLLGPALLAHLAGAALTIDSLSAASIALAVPGAVWLSQGPQRLRALLPVLALLLFAIPTPLVVQGRLAFELKEIAVDTGVRLAQLAGTDVVRSGSELRVPGEETGLLVADACSGLRSLVALVTLGYCLAFFIGSQRGARRWVIFAAAAPIAIVTNALRIAAICVMADHQGVDFASTTGHEIANVAIWAVDLGLLLAIDALFGRRVARRSG